jgi:diguanylate cyclase (GGDEF)-like protein
MAADLERRRVLIVAGAAERPGLRELIDRVLREEWEALEADSFERAAFLLQHDSCDVLLVDESLYQPNDSEGLSWLAAQREAPVVFLSGPAPETVTDVLERGVSGWLPRQLALGHPALLAAALNQAVRWNDQRQRIRLAGEALYECRRQVSRLVSLLWDTAPGDTRTRWCTQRHILERLHEEVARSDRHGNSLAVVLGEVETSATEESRSTNPPHLGQWTAEQIGRLKRRSDVGGQYGPQGFMLLLPHTAEIGAAQCCRRLKKVLEQGADLPAGLQLPVHVNFGLAAYSEAMRSPKSLLSAAEQRLQDAKNARLDRLATD